eukprot:SAG11_NODE_533_length_8703_cov_7.183054_6_plen_604_part_00
MHAIFQVLAEPTPSGMRITPYRIWRVMDIAGEKVTADELADIFGTALHIEGDGTEQVLDVLSSEIDLRAFGEAVSAHRKCSELGPLEGGRSFSSQQPDATVQQFLRERNGHLSDSARSGLPEWALDAVEGHSGYEPLPIEKRNGIEFWNLLARKLENALLVHQWVSKDVETLDRTHHGLTDEGLTATNCVSTFFTRDPEGTLANMWNITQIFLLIYVCFTVPYAVGFDFYFEHGTPGYSFELFVDIFFLVDILLNFRTGYELSNGTMVTESRAIAVHYMKGWFLVDVLSCLSVVGYFIPESEGSSTSARMGKTLRVLRLSKLLRLARLERVLAKMNFNIGPIVQGITILVSSVLCFHVFGCAWHWVGSSDEFDVDGQVVHGWVNKTSWDSDGIYAQAIFTAIYGSVLDPTVNEMWALIILHFTINGIMYGMLTASLASLLVSLTASKQRFSERMDCVRDWLVSRRVSSELRSSVYDFFLLKYKSEKIFDERELMAELGPSPLVDELVREMYFEILERVPLFRGVPAEIVTCLCHSLLPLPVLASHNVRAHDDPRPVLFTIPAWLRMCSALALSRRISEHSNAQNHILSDRLAPTSGVPPRRYC